MKRLYNKFIYVVILLIMPLVIISCDKDSDGGYGSNGVFRNNTIHIAQAGTFASLLPKDGREKITELKLSGYMNGDDIRTLQALYGIRVDGNPTLQKLDLSDVTIVSGGGKYLLGYDYTTSDYTISEYMLGGFYGTELVIPKNTKVILDGAFSGCQIHSLSIPDGVEKVSEHAFAGLACIQELIIPESVEGDILGVLLVKSLKKLIVKSTSLKITSIFDCPELESIDLYCEFSDTGGSVWNLPKLKSVKLHGNVEKISLFCNGCPLLTEVILPEGLRTIEVSSFSDCPALKELIIPSTVKTIDPSALCNTGLTELHLKCLTPPWESISSFKRWHENDLKQCTLYVPKQSLSAYQEYSDVFKSVVGE